MISYDYISYCGRSISESYADQHYARNPIRSGIVFNDIGQQVKTNRGSGADDANASS